MRPAPADPDPPKQGDGTLELSWPAEPGQRFEYQLARDEAFSDVVVAAAVAEPHATIALPPPDAYYLRVRGNRCGWLHRALHLTPALRHRDTLPVVAWPGAVARVVTGKSPLISRSLREWLSVLLTCSLLAGAATGFGWLWRIDQVIYDGAMSMSSRSVDDDVVVVAIDDTSIARIGRWPWPRRYMPSCSSGCMRRAPGRWPWMCCFEPALADPAGDEALASAMRLHGAVVLPVVQASAASGIVTEAPPAPIFASEAAAIGHIHVEFDPDGIARSVYLWEGLGQASHPQLGLALLGLVDPRRRATTEILGCPGRAGYAPVGCASPSWGRRAVSPTSPMSIFSPAACQRLRCAARSCWSARRLPAWAISYRPHLRLQPADAGVEVHANVFSALRHHIAVRQLPPRRSSSARWRRCCC